MRNKDGLMEIWRKIPAFLWPSTKSFQKVKDDSVREFSVYLAVCLLFLSAAIIIFFDLYSTMPLLQILYAIFFTIILNLIFVFVVSVVSYAVAMLLGGKAGYKDMALVVIYSFTPAYFLGWLPAIGILAAALSFGNLFVGVLSIFRLNLWRSILVAVAPLAVSILLVILFVFIIFQSLPEV